MTMITPTSQGWGEDCPYTQEGVTYLQEPSAKRWLGQKHASARVDLAPARRAPQAACTFLSHGVCCPNAEVCEPDFSVALVFGFHFLILNLLPPPPSCITEGQRPEKSLLLRGPAHGARGGEREAGRQGGQEVLRAEGGPGRLAGQTHRYFTEYNVLFFVQIFEGKNKDVPYTWVSWLHTMGRLIPCIMSTESGCALYMAKYDTSFPLPQADLHTGSGGDENTHTL